MGWWWNKYRTMMEVIMDTVVIPMIVVIRKPEKTILQQSPYKKKLIRGLLY